MSKYFAVTNPSPRDLAAALRLFVGGQAGAEQDRQVERCRKSLAGGEFDPDGLFVTYDDAGGVNGVALVQVMPGALGVAWPPRGETAGIEDALAQTACDWLRKRGVKVCQAFADSADRAAMAPLERNGFVRITQLAFMSRETAPSPPEGGSHPPIPDSVGWVESALADEAHQNRVSPRPGRWASSAKADSTHPTRGSLPSPPASLPEGEGPGVREVPVSGDVSPECRRVLLETHTGTLDCPELNDLRSPEEIVAGFFPADAGASWHEIHDGERLVGVLLFEPAPDAGVQELSYLGLVPAARRRGCGSAAVAYALRAAARAGYRQLNLSVDDRNEPALRLYRRHGFAETHRHDVYLARWPGGS